MLASQPPAMYRFAASGLCEVDAVPVEGSRRVGARGCAWVAAEDGAVAAADCQNVLSEPCKHAVNHQSGRHFFTK